MNILIFGRGTISTQYGWVFKQAGHTVEFYVRPGRMADYGSCVHLNILDARNSAKGKPVKLSWPIKMREDIPTQHDFDLMLVCVQHYQFKDVAEFLSTRVAKASILVFNNFWNDPSIEASALPKDRVVWGFPGAGGGFDGNGVLNGAFFKNVFFGVFGTKPTERGIAIRNLFTSCNFKIDEKSDFKTWLLVHFAMNVGIHLQILQTGSALTVCRSSGQWKNVILNVRELLPVLEARGANLEKSSELGMLRLPPLLISLLMRTILKISPPMRMVLVSHTNIEELKANCRDAWTEANRLGISVPRLAANQMLFE
jgi:2-dehydropantoate 2-reductase